MGGLTFAWLLAQAVGEVAEEAPAVAEGWVEDGGSCGRRVSRWYKAQDAKAVWESEGKRSWE